MCWNVKKLTSSHLLQNPKRENRKDNRDLYKNKKEKEVPIIQVQDQNKIIKERRKKNKVRQTKVKDTK